jgi:hypothetical protein
MEKSTLPQKPRLWREEIQDPLALTLPPPYKLRTIILVIAALLALAGLVVGLLFWVRPAPNPHFVPLWVTAYEAPQIPPIPNASQDLQALARGGYFANQPGSALSFRHGQRLLQELEQLTDVHQPLVVYLSARALRAEAGEVFLLPGDADPDNPATRLALGDVLQKLKKCPAPNKLLILDIAHGPAQPRLGAFSSDVAEAIPEEVEALDDPNLLVLCSCSPGQVALTSEVLGRSVFGYYVEQGLRGWADGFQGANKRDGRVSAKELAAFVQARVDRWALQNRDMRQTPLLLGKGADFQLHAFGKGEHQPAPELPAQAKYPKWLESGWKTLQATHDSGAYRLTPALFRHQTALLLRAEQVWRGGMDVNTIQANELTRFNQIQRSLTQLGAFPRPQPQSLALTRTLGPAPEDSVSRELNELFTKMNEAGRGAKPEDAEKARAKLIDEFLAKAKAKPFAELAQAVFARAVELEGPTPQQMRVLDDLLQSAAPAGQRRLAEVLVLHHLAAESSHPEASHWPTGLVTSLLQATDKGERAAASLRAYPWNKALLEEAAQLRHEGEVRVWAGGYASADEAAELLHAAIERYDAILATSSQVEEGQALLDEAVWFLPAYLPYLEDFGQDEQTWLEAVQSAAALYDLLLAPIAAAAEAGGKLNDVRRHAGDLRQKLDQLQQPFSADNLQHLLAMAAEPRPRPAVWKEIDAVLKTPFPPTATRKKLWEAALSLERRLHTATAEQDQEDDEAQETGAELPDFEPSRAIAQRREEGKRQAGRLLAMFTLAGFNEKKLHTLQQQFRKAAADRAPDREWYTFTADLRQAWGLGFKQQYDSDPSPAYRDRLLRLFPPLDNPPGLKTDVPADAAQALGEQARQLWAWLADRYRYEARDYLGSALPGDAVRTLGEFSSQAAAAYGALGRPEPEQYIQVSGGAGLPQLSTARPSAALKLNVQATGAEGRPPAAEVEVRMLLADRDWLRVQPPRTILKDLVADPAATTLRSGGLSVEVELKSSAELSAAPPPRGFLVKARAAGRSFHRGIDVPLRTTGERMQVVFSTNPAQPDPPLDALRLRPGKVRQTYYLYLYNPGRKTQNVIVQLLQGGMPLKGGEAKVTVEAGKSTRVPLPGEAGPPAKTEPAPAKTEGAKGEAAVVKSELPPLEGPLAVRVIDASDKSLVLFTRTVEVAVASPREYVTVSSTLFDPAAPRNQARNKLSVTLQTTAAVPGPDIPVELVLPLDRIPGLMSAKQGTYRGALKTGKGPAELVLFAQGIELAPGAKREGDFLIHVDGYPRCFAFHTLFTRSGDPLTPRLDSEPAVRFAVPPFAGPSAKFAVTIEVDNAPEDARLEVALGRRQAGEFQADAARSFTGPRDQRIGFRLDGASGGLIFEGAATDWQVILDTSQIIGERLLQARLLDGEGRLLAQTVQPITFDDTPPEQVKFLQYPAKAKKGTKILVKAAGRDTESGIASAAFFLGAREDGKVPPKTTMIPAAPVDAKKSVWQAEVLLPEGKGPTPLTVEMTNRVGLKSYDTVRIELTDADPGTTGPSKIRGKIIFGQYAQPDVDVFLIDEKGKLKDKTKTNKDGVYEFQNVAPGLYRVYSIKRGSRRKGHKDVTVKPAETKEVNIDLGL